jgi:hypothetical protein
MKWLEAKTMPCGKPWRFVLYDGVLRWGLLAARAKTVRFDATMHRNGTVRINLQDGFHGRSCPTGLGLEKAAGEQGSGREARIQKEYVCYEV